MESLRRKVLMVVLAQSQHFCLSEAARSSRGQGGHATSPVASVSGEAIFPGEAQCTHLPLPHARPHLAPGSQFPRLPLLALELHFREMTCESRAVPAHSPSPAPLWVPLLPRAPSPAPSLSARLEPPVQGQD